MAEKTIPQVRVATKAMPATFVAGASDPIDSRFVVNTYDDLLNVESFPHDKNTGFLFIYEGLQVYVRDEGATYTFMPKWENVIPDGVPIKDSLVEENWIKTSSRDGLAEKGNYVEVFEEDFNVREMYIEEGDDDSIDIYTKDQVNSKIKEVIESLGIMSLLPTNGYEYVDMGEAGIWAKYPIGVSEWDSNWKDNIKYFQWGDIEGYTASQVGVNKEFSSDWSDYKWGDLYDHITKYCTDSEYGKDGFTDNLTTLLPEDDACVQNMGGNWRMPTTDEFQTLYNLCSTEWVTNYNGVSGLNGRLFKLETDESKQLFFPASGCCEDGVGDVGSWGDFYSSSLSISSPSKGLYLAFGSDRIYPNTDYFRFAGYPIVGFLDSSIKSEEYLPKKEAEEIYATKEELKEVSSETIIIPILKQNSDELYSFGGSDTTLTFSYNDYNLLQKAYEEGSSTILKAADATVDVLYMRKDTQLELGYIVNKHGSYYFEVIRYDHPERTIIFDLVQSTPITSPPENEIVVIPLYFGNTTSLYDFNSGTSPFMSVSDYDTYIKDATNKDAQIILKGSTSNAQLLFVDGGTTLGFINYVQGKPFFTVIKYNHPEINIAFSIVSSVQLSDLNLSLYSRIYMLTIDTKKEQQIYDADINNIINAYFNQSIKNTGNIKLQVCEGNYTMHILTCTDIAWMGTTDRLTLEFVALDRLNTSKVTVYKLLVIQNNAVTYTTDEYILLPKDFINIKNNNIEIGKDEGNVLINGVLNTSSQGIEFDGPNGEVLTFDYSTFNNITNNISKLSGITKVAEDSDIVNQIIFTSDKSEYSAIGDKKIIELFLSNGLEVRKDEDNYIDLYIDTDVISTRKYVDDKINFLVNEEGQLEDTFDTLKEVDTWIKSHEGEAASLIKDINTLKDEIKNLKEELESLKSKIVIFKTEE
ncbi:MAG: hypothetical protein J1F35_03510 [Erysipelotrichales bacterium]|nr:hypothetical protein [Erysipelotrichales bacterium]